MNASTQDEPADELALIAYRTSDYPKVRIVAGSRRCEWMDATADHFAYRCLPLAIANESGWYLISGHSFRAWRNGGADPRSVRIEWLKGWAPYPVSSHFGYGILTWTIPYLFRLPPGFNLRVTGPPNWPKDGVSALEGIVEADWSVAPFTMNWKMTQSDKPVIFEENQPFCFIVQQRRTDLERIRPEIRTMDPHLDLAHQHLAWVDSRADFLRQRESSADLSKSLSWQGHYYRGNSPGGTKAHDHRTKMALEEFVEK